MPEEVVELVVAKVVELIVELYGDDVVDLLGSIFDRRSYQVFPTRKETDMSKDVIDVVVDKVSDLAVLLII